MIEPIDDSGPAFPFKTKDAAGGRLDYPGMSLRDWFAGMALQGLLSLRVEDGDDGNGDGFAGPAYSGKFTGPSMDSDEQSAAEDAYLFADAMIQERKARKDPS